MMRFIKQIANFKWAWQSKYKLTIEAEMTKSDLKDFLRKNNITAETQDVDKVEISITIKADNEQR